MHLIAIALALSFCFALPSAAQDRPLPRPRSFPIEIKPAESLPPNPRAQVELVPLTPPASAQVDAAFLEGRWVTDPRWCSGNAYVHEWRDGRRRLLLDGRLRHEREIVFVPEARATLLREPDGTAWRVERIDQDRIRWTDYLPSAGQAQKTDQELQRCPPEPPAPPPVPEEPSYWVRLVAWLETLWK